MGAPLVSGAVDINQGRSVVFSRKRSTIKWLKIYKQTKRREVQGGPPPLLLLLLHLQRNQKKNRRRPRVIWKTELHARRQVHSFPF